MADSVCFISDDDFARHFQQSTDITPPTVWSGTERRVGLKTRRTGAHERRWEACIGRRNRLLDRRLPRRLKG